MRSQRSPPRSCRAQSPARRTGSLGPPLLGVHLGRRSCRDSATAEPADTGAAGSLLVSSGMSRRAMIARGPRLRLAGVAAGGMAVVLVSGQIEPMALRARPNDGVDVAMRLRTVLGFIDEKMLLGCLTQGNGSDQAHEHGTGDKPRHVFPFRSALRTLRPVLSVASGLRGRDPP